MQSALLIRGMWYQLEASKAISMLVDIIDRDFFTLIQEYETPTRRNEAYLPAGHQLCRYEPSPKHGRGQTNVR